MKQSKETTNLTMETLSLPKELFWDGKMEPTSPSSELFSISESIEQWLLKDNFATDISLTQDTCILELKTGLEVSSQIHNGDDFIVEFYNVKEEQWTDTKLYSTQFLDYNSLGTLIEEPTLVTKVQNPFDLNEGASGYNATILTQLTPPQSPPQISVAPLVASPHDGHNVKEILDFIVQHQPSSLSPTPSSCSLSSAGSSAQSVVDNSWSNASNVGSSASDFEPLQSEIERETQIVDEILKTRAKELLDWNEDLESMSSLSPPSMLSSNEEEWVPTSPSTASYSPNSPEYSARKMPSLLSSNISKKRTRPYGRALEDRKTRKKEQNKNAATRYRQKKKQEMECVLSEEQELVNRNDELKSVLADRKREAKYLKTLIREFYQKKNSK